jgi:hypothetical protein
LSISYRLAACPSAQSRRTPLKGRPALPHRTGPGSIRRNPLPASG